MRFGLVGTGFWAAEVHARALHEHPDTELVAVWGRNEARATAVAERWGATAHPSLDALLAEVDAVAFAVPPDVQGTLAPMAAAAGRHLLLEKPVARSVAAADALVAAVEATDVATTVFLTWRFDPHVAGWVDAVAGGAWHGGSADWYGSIADGPFDTPWRREPGAALWDLGPHALSIVVPVLGTVVAVRAATHDAHGTVRLLLEHEGGATSTLAVTGTGPAEAATSALRVVGEGGWSQMPDNELHGAPALLLALDHLLAAAPAGSAPHDLDVRTGAAQVRVLAEAASLLDGAG